MTFYQELQLNKNIIRKNITIPNILSFFRLCLIPVLIWSYCLKKEYLLAALILVLSGITDLADGYIARKFNMISNLGKILDPVADKLTQLAMLFCLTTRFRNILLLFVLMVVKEAYMAVSGCLVIKKTGKVFGADWHGKIVTFVLYAVIVLHVLWVSIPEIVSNIFIAVCGGCMLISLVVYIIKNTKMLKEG